MGNYSEIYPLQLSIIHVQDVEDWTQMVGIDELHLVVTYCTIS